LFNRVFGFLGQHGVQPVSAPIGIYHDPEFHETDVDVEIAIPVAADLPADDKVVLRELPALESAACLIHQGGYDTIHASYGHLMQWLETNGYRINGPLREVYARGPESGDDTSSYITELQAPVEKA
jgi:effector-binding domain-containing protein